MPLQIRSSLRAFRRDDRGATLTETLVICGLVGIVAFLAFRSFGSTLRGGSEGQAKTVMCIPGAAGQPGCAGGAPGGAGAGPTGGAGGGTGVGAIGAGAGAGGSGEGESTSAGGAGAGDDPIAANSGPVCNGEYCVPGSGNCFVAGTPVATPNGTLGIESLRRGDLVLARDEDTGLVSAAHVVRTFARLAPSLVDVRILSAGGAIDTLRSTPEHRFWTRDRGWAEAVTLTPGEPLLGMKGDELATVSVTELPLEAPVFNIEVERAHTYFVGRASAWVHNYCSGWIQVGKTRITGKKTDNQGIFIPNDYGNNGGRPYIYVNPNPSSPNTLLPGFFEPAGFSNSTNGWVAYKPVQNGWYPDCLHTAEECMHGGQFVDPATGGPLAHSGSQLGGVPFGESDPQNIAAAQAYAAANPTFVNGAASPAVGQGYAIVNTGNGGTYPYHAEGVVAQAGNDTITFWEAAGNEDAENRTSDGNFAVYSPAKPFHDFHTGSSGLFDPGNSVTVTIGPSQNPGQSTPWNQ